MKKGNKNIWFLLCAFGAAFLLQLVAAFAVMLPAMVVKEMQIVSMGLSGTAEETEMINQLSVDLTGPAVLVTHIILLLSFALWYYFGCCKRVSFVNSLKNTFAGKNILIIAVLAVGSCYLTNFAMPLAGMIIPENIMQSYIDLMETAGFGTSILPTIAAILIAPFGEELIFRGVMYHYAKGITAVMTNRRAAFYIANVIQALAFGIFHGNLVQGSYAFLMGLLLGYLRERFGSIWASVLAHMIINFASSFLWAPIVMNLPDVMPTYIIGSAVSLSVVIIGMKMGGPALPEEEKI